MEGDVCVASLSLAFMVNRLIPETRKTLYGNPAPFEEDSHRKLRWLVCSGVFYQCKDEIFRERGRSEGCCPFSLRELVSIIKRGALSTKRLYGSYEEKTCRTVA
jgi:hypothetical protein